MDNLLNRVKVFFIPGYLDEDKKRAAGILLMVSSTILLGLMLLLGYRLIIGKYNLFFSLSIACCFVLLSLFMIHKQHLSFSANFLLWFMMLFVLYLMFTNDGLHDSVIVAIPAILIIGGLVLSKKHFYIITIFCLIAITVLGILEVQGFIKISFNGSAVYSDIIDVLIILFISAFSIRLFTENLTDSLHKARNIEFLAQTLKSVKDAVSITDNNDDVIFVNDAFISTYGYTEKEIIGKKISFIRPLDTSAAMEATIHAETIKGGWHGEVLNHRKNGEHFTVELWTSIVKDKEGAKIGTVGVARDITDRKKAENELIQAKEAAEEMSRLKSNFLSNMSHELRTPLVGILGFAEILLDELVNENHKEMIVKITQGAGRLSLTLNQILDLSKIETNRSSIEWAKIDLSHILNEVIKIYSTAAFKKNLLLKTSFPQSGLLILGDERMLLNIFNNLINNAVKYTFRGDISVDSFVEKCESGKFIVVKVADNGIGIPEDKLEIIFEEFRQVSEGLSRGYEGTGLGLTLCKKFVNLLNGSIYVESEQGKGSTFTVRFPMYIDIS
jgi:PAS domain S-box-containing protein